MVKSGGGPRPHSAADRTVRRQCGQPPPAVHARSAAQRMRAGSQKSQLKAPQMSNACKEESRTNHRTEEEGRLEDGMPAHGLVTPQSTIRGAGQLVGNQRQHALRRRFRCWCWRPCVQYARPGDHHSLHRAATISSNADLEGPWL